MRLVFWDRDGNPIDALTWGRMYGDFEGRVIQRTTVGDVDVLTVWLGVDEYDRQPPGIFGTVIHRGTSVDHETRSATEAEALVAHRVTVHYVQTTRRRDR